MTRIGLRRRKKMWRISLIIVLSMLATPAMAKKKKPRHDYWFVVCSDVQPDDCLILTTRPIDERE